MSTADKERARAVTRHLLAACSPDGDTAEAPASAAFRCWTPIGDWERGEAGLAALTGILSAFCGAAGTGSVSPNAVITDGVAAVVEAATEAGPGQSPLGMTLLLVMSAGLVDEVMVYVDPAALAG
ncbi:MAG TPA: hypothetical protein VMV07_12010 [Streptosporangiaceae bacterium]|nr:hypothetical protein [Streptosporangiaceae bacterium]